MKHLRGGVKKGAFDEAEAQKRFDAWNADKDARINAVVTKLQADKRNDEAKRKDAEVKVNEEIAKRVAEKKASIAAAQAEEAAKAAEAEAPAEEQAPAQTEEANA